MKLYRPFTASEIIIVCLIALVFLFSGCSGPMVVATPVVERSVSTTGAVLAPSGEDIGTYSNKDRSCN